MEGLVIRKAEEKDLPIVQEITDRILGEYFKLYYKMQFSLSANYLSPDCLVYVATVQDKIIGCIKAFRSGTTTNIHEFVVEKEYRNKGVGQLLLDHVEKEIYERFYKDKFGRFELQTALESGNVEFYIRRGYHIALITDNAVANESKRVFMMKTYDHYQYLNDLL